MWKTCYLWIDKKVYITWFFQGLRVFIEKDLWGTDVNIHINLKIKTHLRLKAEFFSFQLFGQIEQSKFSLYLRNFSRFSSFYGCGYVLNITLSILRHYSSLASKHLFVINKIRAKAVLDVHGHCVYIFKVIQNYLTLFYLTFPFDLYENIRKPLLFLCFVGNQKRVLEKKELTPFAPFSIILIKMIWPVKKPLIHSAQSNFEKGFLRIKFTNILTSSAHTVPILIWS